VVKPPRPDDGGFTYLGLLFAIALSAGTLAVAASLWSTEAKRDREAQLLFAGDQIRAAISAYRDEAPAGQSHVFPKSFDDLLEDKRWPVRRRHLRKVFADPMTGSAEWGIVAASDGGILGVYSRSEAVPLKRGGFPVAYADFSEAGSYRDWQFVYTLPAEAPASPRVRRPS
jgi:type II secretory pathway pseudopilin PulG